MVASVSGTIDIVRPDHGPMGLTDAPAAEPRLLKVASVPGSFEPAPLYVCEMSVPQSMVGLNQVPMSSFTSGFLPNATRARQSRPSEHCSMWGYMPFRRTREPEGARLKRARFT